MRRAVAALRAAVVGETGRGVRIAFKLELRDEVPESLSDEVPESLSEEVPESLGEGRVVDVLVIVDDGSLLRRRWRDSGPGFSLAALRCRRISSGTGCRDSKMG